MSRLPKYFGISIGILVLLCSSRIVRAEHLPTRAYTTAEGLVDNRISRIVLDSRGFLWFCTEGGLSRFDGYSFTNYTVKQGLPNNEVNDLLEDRAGTYWIATGKGLCRFDPRGMPLALPAGQPAPASLISSRANPQPGSQPMFTVYRPGDDPRSQAIKTLYEDRGANLWCGTWRGLYRVDRHDRLVEFVSVDIGTGPGKPDSYIVKDIVQDRRGILWITSDNGLSRLLPDGKCERFTTKNGLASNVLLGLLEDRSGRMWVGNQGGGLCQIAAEPDARNSIVVKSLSLKDGLACTDVAALYETRDHKIWIGTNCGLSEMLDDGSGTSANKRLIKSVEALADAKVWSLAEDGYGNLWVGSAGGAVKIAKGGITTYTVAEGLGSRNVVGIVETEAGEISVETQSPRQAFINRFDGHRFIPIRLNLPDPGLSYDWHMVAPAKNGEWWLVTVNALWRYAETGSVLRLLGKHPKNFYGVVQRPPGTQPISAYIDSRDDVWISVGGEGKLRRWDRRTGSFQIYSESDGLPPIKEFVHSFCEDHDGDLWLSFGSSGLARYQNGRFRLFGSADGIPTGEIRTLFADREGRVWISSSQGGLGRIDDPASENPRFSSYKTASGISSDDVWCVVESDQGRLYVGTAHGLDQLDPASGRVRHFTVADGLANNRVRVSLRDHNGTLWFGTETGLSRLIPEPDLTPDPPPIYVNRLRISGDDYPLSALGETTVRGIQLAPDQNHVEIDFGGISFDAGQNLRYQFKLDGAGTDWSQPNELRTANYLELGPGAYQFQVRAVNAENVYSLRPATIEFAIPRPVWQRWWFIMLAVMLAGFAVYGGYRFRLARLLELERVRTRIASDLHDDIGASLSRVALMTEVVKQELGSAAGPPHLLTEIADTARGLVDSMSDIVWSTDPGQDDLNSVVQRLRAFASDVLEARNIRWDFESPDGLEKVRLAPEQRRHLFLILKEAVNNIARHSDSAAASITIAATGNKLTAMISDDGRGFVPGETRNGAPGERGGHGVENMKMRAVELGGTLDIFSEPGRGTRLTLSVPL